MKRKPIIAIDFDGTIVEHNYPEIGNPLPDAIQTIHWISTWADIIIWTCRYEAKDLIEMIDFLNEHNIKYTKINENIEGIGFVPSPKIYFDIGIDDRNLYGLPPWINIRVELEKYKIKGGY